VRNCIRPSITVGVRVLGGLVLISSCLLFEGCKSSREQKVIRWVQSMPQSPEDARKHGVPYYSTDEQWAAAGRNTGGLEETLIRLIRRDHFRKVERWKIANALGEVGSAKSVPVLIRLLEDKSEADNLHDVRKYAIHALGELGDARAVVPLSRIVSDEGEAEHVRLIAIQALSNIGDRRAIPVVERVVDANIFTGPYSSTYQQAIEGYLEELRRKAGAK